MSEIYNLQKGDKFKMNERGVRVYELLFAGKEKCRFKDLQNGQVFILRSHSLIFRV